MAEPGTEARTRRLKGLEEFPAKARDSGSGPSNLNVFVVGFLTTVIAAAAVMAAWELLR